MLMRTHIGAVAAFRHVCVVPKLPKTRSGKILRAALRSLADGAKFEIPPTIEDPAVIEDIRAMLGSMRHERAPFHISPNHGVINDQS